MTDPPVLGVIHHFDEMTEQGSLGFATLATADKGRLIFEAAVNGVQKELETVSNGYVLRGF